MPPALVEALVRIGDQVVVEILDPLLCATSIEQLANTFERVFPKFRDYYVSTVLIMWGALQDDPERFSALTIRSFQESDHLIRSCGARWIGQDASLNALRGIAAITRVAKAATMLFDQERCISFEPIESNAEPWANSIIAYAMAFSSVLASLNALSSGQAISARLENVAALAHWSTRYAVQAYHLTKSMGLLKTAAPRSPAGRSEEEDLVLAEAGLES